MSNSGNSIKQEAIRELDAATITNGYQNLGSVLGRDAFRLTIINNTNGDVYVSTDGSTNQMKFPAYSARILDDKTNDMYRKKGTQFSIKYSIVPGIPAGWFGLEVEYV